MHTHTHTQTLTALESKSRALELLLLCFSLNRSQESFAELGSLTALPWPHSRQQFYSSLFMLIVSYIYIYMLMYVCILSRNIYFAILPWHAYIASALFKVCPCTAISADPCCPIESEAGLQASRFPFPQVTLKSLQV